MILAVPEFESLEVNVLPSDDIVVTDAAGDILYSGWFNTHDEPRGDGRLFWQVNFHPTEEWDNWLLTVGGLNQVEETSEESGEYKLLSGGSNATFATEFFYRDEMSRRELERDANRVSGL